VHKPTGPISAEMAVLSSYMAAAGQTPLPEAAAEGTKHHILDTIAAMVSGSRLVPGEKGAQFVGSLGGKPEAGVIGTSIVTGAAHAALANGMSAHADETDDSHYVARMHPGAAIVPAALAVAQRENSSGALFLNAVALGYDVGTRVVTALGMHGHPTINRSTHSFGGTFGAGAAAAALMKFGEEQMRFALSYSAQLASGCGSYMHDAGHVEKAFVYSGKTAQDGVMAASMVAEGFTAGHDVFSGDRNFLDAYAINKRPEILSAGLGTEFAVLATNIKKWCVGSPIQAALDGIVALLAEGEIVNDAIAEIAIHMGPNHARTVDGRPMPNVNIQHLMGLMLVDRTMTFASSHDESRLDDPRVKALARLVKLKPSEELALAKPPRQTIVELIMKDGTRRSTRVIAVRGTADNRMGRAEVVEKAIDLIAPVLGADRAREIAERVLNVERDTGMARWRELLAS
jgi:2-methylcitrate dehydratase PrpD